VFNVNTAKAFGLSFPPGLIAIARALRASAMTTPRTGAGFQRPGADRFRVFALSAVAGEAGPPSTARTVKTTAGAVEKGVPSDIKSVVEQDGSPTRAGALHGVCRRGADSRLQREEQREFMSNQDPDNTPPYTIDRNWSARSARIGWTTGHAVCFGPFKLLPLQRLLLKGDQQVRLGSRALDVLITLTERPGQLISKDELMARVWPGIFVVPANLTVHITALRRALGDGVNGNRFVVNVPGRGYCFTASVTAECTEPVDSFKQQTDLARIRDRWIDRDEVAQTRA
jgi:DNA-binding winged helix-turn-helix (wHTH) protein